MYLILFGIHQYDLTVLKSIMGFLKCYRMSSQLHKDNNTAVEDQREKTCCVYVQFPVLWTCNLHTVANSQ